jgi:hypothetical protein
MESSMPRPRLFVLALAFAVLLVPSAGASGTFSVVISQLYGGGGNAGAPLTHDYVELFNGGTAPVDLGGWSVQYATAAGTAWQATPLVGTIQPGRRYLVQLGGGGDGAPMPAADAIDATNLSATSGKVALVRDIAPLACGASAGSCAASPLVEDLVGYGGAVDYEGSGAAPGLSSTTAAVRAAEGCSDTDVNAADFSAGEPAPRNAAAAAHECSATPAPTAAVSAGATVEVDVQSVVSLVLERPALAFGAVSAGATPSPLSERVTVLSNGAAGYALSAQRTPFTPADLPLALAATAPPGGALGSTLTGGGLVAIPVGPASLSVGTKAAPSEAAGDVWATAVGFAAPLPSVSPGRYTATLTFTVVPR